MIKKPKVVKKTINRPKFKKKCRKCDRFRFIKAKLHYCLECWEKENGKYTGDDREVYVND